MSLLSEHLTDSNRYFIIHNLADGQEEIIRYSALLRGTESAWQAVSYGLESIPIFGEIGGIYMNFGLYALAIVPAFLVIRHFGASKESFEEEVTVTEVAETQKGVSAGSSGEESDQAKRE